MAEYIEREALLDRMNNFCEINCDYTKNQRSVMCGACGIGDAKIMVEDAVAADVQSVVRGTWEDVDVQEVSAYTSLPITVITSMRCNKCLKYHNEVYFYGNPTEYVNFCPNCGADMRWIEDGETN